MKNDKNNFYFVGNNLAVDFVNTEVVGQEGVIELLNDHLDVYRWADTANISVDKNDTNVDIQTILALRMAIKQLFLARMDGQKITTKILKTINQHLLNAVNEQQLINRKNELILQDLDEKLSLKKFLGRITQSAVLLITSKQVEQLKRCANVKCVLIFLDTSRAKKRRWCSMDLCGNRSKAANHYLNAKSA